MSAQDWRFQVLRPVRASGAVAVDADPAVQIAPERKHRRALVIQNLGPNEVYIGPENTVTDTTGLSIASGSSFTDEQSSSAWWAICSAAETADVRYIEIY